jgi:hypothetical protein
MKTESEIVRTEVEIGGADIGWEDAYQQVQNMRKDSRNRVVRFNDSIFVATAVEPGVAKFFMCNADSLKNMHKSLQNFFNLMAEENQKLLWTTKRKAMIRMLNKTGYQIKYSLVDGLYTGEVIL